MGKGVNWIGASARWRLLGWGVLILLLAAPAVAMRFTSEVRWSASDFAIAALLLIALGVGIELTTRHTRGGWQLTGLLTVVAGSFLTVWLAGAVGIIGDEANPLNRAILALLAAGLLAGAIARFRPRPMATITALLAAGQLALVATAIAQAVSGWQPALVFVILWTLATLCFRRAEAGPLRL